MNLCYGQWAFLSMQDHPVDISLLSNLPAEASGKGRRICVQDHGLLAGAYLKAFIQQANLSLQKGNFYSIGGKMLTENHLGN